MHRREAAALLNYASSLDGRISRLVADEQRAAHTISRWAEALADVPTKSADGAWDAAHVVRGYYEQRGGDTSARFYAVEPHHLLAAWAEHRREVLTRHTDPTPDADPDNPAAWRAELRATRRAVAHGHTSPARHRAAVDPAGQARLTALATGVGRGPRRYVPDHVARQLTTYRPRRAAREAALDEGLPDPYAHPCTWCGAQPEQPCRTRLHRHGRHGTGQNERATPHPCRIDAATRAAEQDEDERKRLTRLMTTPPQARDRRARHTTGGEDQ